MSTSDQLKNQWDESQPSFPGPASYDRHEIERIVKSRTRKHTNAAMQYFWGAFVLQLIVYGLLSHVIIKYGADAQTLQFSLAGVVLFLLFTAMLMSKFKQIALINPNASNKEGVLPLFHYVERRRVLLQSFYSFKKRYEILLIPLATAIGVFLTFRLYVPGGVLAHPEAAIIAFAITISSCILAIRSENRKNFDRPIRELDKILDDFRREG